MKDVDYFTNHPEEFDLLSDDQKELVVSGGNIDQGETEAAAIEANADETSETPDAGTETKEPVLLAKDGVHTIPYSELVNERQRNAELAAFVENQNRLIEELKQAQLQDEGTGETAAQDAVLEAYEGAFPEIADDMVPFIKNMIDTGIKQGLAAFQKQVETLVAPAVKVSETAAIDAHFAQIDAAHPDREAILDDVGKWIESRPAFIKDHYANVFNTGSAAQVIELISEYKASNGVNADVKQPSADDIRVKAKQSIADAKTKPVNSLSDIPSGNPAAHDEAEAMLNMNQRQLEAKFANKSPEEIMRLLDKIV